MDQQRFLLLLFGIFAAMGFAACLRGSLWRPGVSYEPAHPGDRGAYGAGGRFRQRNVDGAPAKPGDDRHAWDRGRSCRRTAAAPRRRHRGGTADVWPGGTFAGCNCFSCQPGFRRCEPAVCIRWSPCGRNSPANKVQSNDIQRQSVVAELCRDPNASDPC